MTDQTKPAKAKGAVAPTAAARREDRLKLALKANMARRKAQTRARNTGEAGPENDGLQEQES